MREALLGGASGVSSLFDEAAKNVVVNVFSGIDGILTLCIPTDYS